MYTGKKADMKIKPAISFKSGLAKNFFRGIASKKIITLKKAFSRYSHTRYVSRNLRKIVRAGIREQRRVDMGRHRYFNLEKSRKWVEAVSKERKAVQIIVNKMTNWQRNRWAKAGYPGLKRSNPSAVEGFLTLKRKVA